MNFELNDEQRMLRDSVRRFVEKAYSFEARRERLRSGRPVEPAYWTHFADSGWLAASLPEEVGGLGGGAVETMLIATELGRGLVVEPFTGSAVLAVQTFVAAADHEQLRRHAAPLADGRRRFALVTGDRLHAMAQENGEGWRLQGDASLVVGGCDAHAYVVCASLPAAADRPRRALFLVEAGSPRIKRTALPLHDGSWAAQATFDGVRLAPQDLLGTPEGAERALRLGRAHGILSLCAELVGGMEKAIELTAEYLKVRHQFGVPIGSFQVLQHRAADMAAELELARSMVYVLLAAIAEGDVDAIDTAASHAKSLVGRAARWVSSQAIQLHGGIGMTMECAIGHYFKRAMVAEFLCGNADVHDARVAIGCQADWAPDHEAASL